MADAACKVHMTAGEYLALEAASAERHEFVDGAMVAMAGSTDTHNDIVYNTTVALRGQFLPRGCKVPFSDVKVLVERLDAYFYPDVFVTCDVRDRADPVVKRHPCLIVEVLSKSTEDYDRGAKFQKYRRLDSLQAYVVVYTSHRQVDVLERQDHPFWRYSTFSTGEALHIERLDIRLTVDDLYIGTNVPAEPDEASTTATPD
ncbi:MAG: Uma2 family endonuclease [Deltaproteobacteria bacterium]|nr:Uma2 family endonuclease [Deltaproteobacteria bacterium]